MDLYMNPEKNNYKHHAGLVVETEKLMCTPDKVGGHYDMEQVFWKVCATALFAGWGSLSMKGWRV